MLIEPLDEQALEAGAQLAVLGGHRQPAAICTMRRPRPGSHASRGSGSLGSGSASASAACARLLTAWASTAGSSAIGEKAARSALT
jgi:hypothetical protein